MDFIFYLIVYAFLILIGFRAHRAIRKSKANFKYLLASFLSLFLFAMLLMLGILNEIHGFINEQTLTKILFFTVIMYLFYVSFITSLNIATSNKKIEILASELAILKEQTVTHTNSKDFTKQ